jgi:polar amino acid transport system substrate-binding protein
VNSGLASSAGALPASRLRVALGAILSGREEKTMSLLKSGLVFLAAALTACASLQDQGSSAGARQQLAPTGKVRAAISVGPTASTFRATLDPATNRPRGVAVDLAHALGRQLGASVELVTYSNYPELLNAAVRGDWDVTFLPFDEERTKVMDYGPAYFFFDFTYLVPEGSPVRAQSDIDRPNVRIAVAEGSVTARNRERALKNATLVPLQDSCRNPGASAGWKSRCGGGGT